jgi:hypothetical protein
MFTARTYCHQTLQNRVQHHHLCKVGPNAAQKQIYDKKEKYEEVTFSG